MLDPWQTIDRRSGAPSYSWDGPAEMAVAFTALYVGLVVLQGGAVALALVGVAILVWTQHPFRRCMTLNRAGWDMLVAFGALLLLGAVASIL